MSPASAGAPTRAERRRTYAGQWWGPANIPNLASSHLAYKPDDRTSRAPRPGVGHREPRRYTPRRPNVHGLLSARHVPDWVDGILQDGEHAVICVCGALGRGTEPELEEWFAFHRRGLAVPTIKHIWFAYVAYLVRVLVLGRWHDAHRTLTTASREAVVLNHARLQLREPIELPRPSLHRSARRTIAACGHVRRAGALGVDCTRAIAVVPRERKLTNADGEVIDLIRTRRDGRPGFVSVTPGRSYGQFFLNISGASGLTRYWVGGTGTWDASTTTHWSATDGGAGGASAPDAGDDARVTVNSGGGTITISAAVCRSLDCTGAPATTIAFASSTLGIGDGSGGALLLVANITVTNTAGTINFVSTSNNGGTGWGITTAGKALPACTFNGAGGKWVAQDNLSVGTNALTVTSGGFFGNGKTVTCGTFIGSGATTRTVDITNCPVNCSGGASAWSFATVTNLTFVSTGSTITVSNGLAGFSGGGLSYGTAVVSAPTTGPTVSGANTFVNLTVTGTATKTNIVNFSGNQTVTGTLTLGGGSTSGVNRLLVQSNTRGTARTFTCTGAAVQINGDVNFMDITVAGSPSWSNAASFVGDAGGNTGLTITVAAAQTWQNARATGSALRLPAVVSNYAATPHAAALAITGDIDLRVRVALDDWTPAGLMALETKWNVGGSQSYWFGVNTNGTLQLYISTTGSDAPSATSSVATGFTDGTTQWVRVTRRQSDGRVQFFTASGALTNPVAADFTQLGTDQTSSSGSAIFSTSSADVEIGAQGFGAQSLAKGNFYRAQIRNGLDGTLVFDADITAVTAAAATFTESSSNAATVTINASNGNYSDSTRWTSRVPLPQDDVSVLGRGTVTSDMPNLGRDHTFTGFNGTWANSVANEMYGSLTLSSTTSTSGTNTLTLAGRGTHTITCSGQNFVQAVTQNGPGGTYTCQDAFSTSLALTMANGTFTAANVATSVTAASVVANAGTVTLNMGTGTWSLQSTAATTIFTANNATTTVNASTSTILIAAASANTRTFSGGGKTYGTLTYTVPGSTGQLTVAGSNTLATINFSDATTARTLAFTNGTTTTITNAFGLNVYGLPGKLMSIVSTTGGSAATISTAGGQTLRYCSLQDITGAGASVIVARNSTNVSGNTNILFESRRPLVARRVRLSGL